MTFDLALSRGVTFDLQASFATPTYLSRSTVRVAMAAPEAQKFEELFECLKLFEVEEGSPTAAGERPSRGFGRFCAAKRGKKPRRCPLIQLLIHTPFSESPSVGSIGIDRCSWRECTDHNILVLVCNNGE